MRAKEILNNQQDVAENQLKEDVGGNYLYYSVESSDDAKLILSSGFIEASSGAQTATRQQTKLPVVSVSRSIYYAVSGANVERDYQVVFVLDRNAIESRYKTFGTSQHEPTKSDDIFWNANSANYKKFQKYSKIDTNRDGKMSDQELDAYYAIPGNTTAFDERPNAVMAQIQNKQYATLFSKYNRSKSGKEFEEVIPVKGGQLPLKGILVGFYLVPNKAAAKDQELLNNPMRLAMPRPNTFVKATQQNVVEDSLEEIDRRGFLRGMGAAAATAAGPGMAQTIPDWQKKANIALQKGPAQKWPGYDEDDGKWPAAKNAPAGSLIAYRGDTRTGKLETLPTLIRKETVAQFLNAYKLCRDNKLLPSISPETWAALLLVEGRSDFGYNGPDILKKYSVTPAKQSNLTNVSYTANQNNVNDKFGPKMDVNLNMTPIRQGLKKLGISENDWRADFCELLSLKIDTARRLGIPFYQAWNGGTQFLNRYRLQMQAIKDPKNKPFMDFIRGILGGGQGVAEGFLDKFFKPKKVKPEMIMNIKKGNGELYVEVYMGEDSTYWIARFTFDMIGDTLKAQDISVTDEYRGRGIAKWVYDTLKNKGYTINRSPYQTDDGKHFWDKNKGANAKVWEQGLAEDFEGITEMRNRIYQYVKSVLPKWPEYVLKDWLVPNKGDFSNLSHDALKKSIMGKLQLTGLSVNTKWQLVPDMKFTMDMWEPLTQKTLIGRAGGHSDMGLGVPKDKERHAIQAQLAKQQGGIRKEPVLLIKTPNGYQLLEGWHRTIQHFAKYPDGYTGPAYVAVAQNQQGVSEYSEQKNTNDLNEKWSQKYKRSIDCSHPKGFSQRAHCQGRKKNEDTLSEKKRRKAKAKRVYGGYAFYPIAAVDSGEGGDGGGLEEGWKEKLAAAGAAGAMALGGYNYVKQPTQTTQQPQPTAQAQQKTIKPITQKPLEKILYNHAVKAGLSGDELAQFMAQCAHETNDWNSLVEYGGSLDFRKYDPKFAPKKAKILGNTKIGDGARYKGRGYIQITGRYNYTKASKALGIDLVNKPELAQHPDTAAEIALLFWKNRVRPNVDDFQNTTQVTKKINAGLRGLEDRHENYQDYLRGSGNNKK